MALAQRLNELAVANSEGLLNDDEYRILRQDVFEQFSNSSTQITVEVPMVPNILDSHNLPMQSPLSSPNNPYSSIVNRMKVDVHSSPKPHTAPSHLDKDISTRPAANDQSQPSPTKPTVKSTMSLFLRRATGRGSQSEVTAETRTPKEKRGFMPRLNLSRKGSVDALRSHLEPVAGPSAGPSRTKSISRTSASRKSEASKDVSSPPVPPMSPSRSSASSSHQSKAGPVTPPPTATSFSLSPANSKLSPRPSISHTSSKSSYTSSISRRTGLHGKASSGLSPSSASPPSSSLLSPYFKPSQALNWSSEIFDDSNLDSAASIRSAMINTETELQNLADMFSQLEANVLKKRHNEQLNSGLIPSPIRSPRSLSPASTNSSPAPPLSLSSSGMLKPILLRKKSSISSLSSRGTSSFSVFSNPKTGAEPYTHGRNDSVATSIASGSDNAESSALGRSRNGSVNLAPPNIDGAAVVGRYRGDSVSKHSLRSVKSADTLNTSRSRPIVTKMPSPPSVGRAGDHVRFDENLAAAIRNEASDVEGIEEISSLEAIEKEFNDVQRRRDEVIWRYQQRLDYLRARLKGAEIAEKVARR